MLKPKPFQDLRVLIVDDDRNNLNLLAEALTAGGMQVAKETNCRAALHQMKQLDFDLIITDINMPEMDGNQLLEIIRKQPGVEMPVIAATATPYMASRNFNRTLCKPYKLSELWTTVRQVLPDSRHRQ